MATLSIPPYPNVPNVLGVPELIRKAAPVTDAIGYINHIDNALERMLAIAAVETWGVFDKNGDDALSPDSFVGIEYRNGSRLADYPMEQGAFETYNKVANPFDACVVMAMGGTVETRNDFLTTIEALCASLDLFTITTPEKSYPSVNLERFDYRREQRNGSHMIVVSLYFREVRITANVNGNADSDSQVNSDPDELETVSAADAESIGQVSPSPLTAAKDAAIQGAATVLASVKGLTGAFKTVTGAAWAAASGSVGTTADEIKTVARGIVK